MKKITTFLLASLFQMQFSHAGVNSLTIHSRANCGNNESITWHLGHYYNLRTLSYHCKKLNDKDYETLHMLETPMQNTWRSAAVHWGEATFYSDINWMVIGDHYMKMGKSVFYLGRTRAEDCSIYDGWWD